MKKNQEQELYENYKKTYNKNEIIQYIYFFNSKELKKMCYDLDTRLNFVVEFIEYHLDKILQNYKSIEKKYNYQVPFTFLQYLRGGLKNAFYSYIKKKLPLFEPLPFLVENLNTQTNFLHKTYNIHSKFQMNFWFLLIEKLNQFSILERIIFKLYYHLELDTLDLEYLIQHYEYIETKKLFEKIKKNYLKKLQYSKSPSKIFFKSSQRGLKKDQNYCFYSSYRANKIISLKEIQKFLKIGEFNIYKTIRKIEIELAKDLKKDKEINFFYSCA